MFKNNSKNNFTRSLMPTLDMSSRVRAKVESAIKAFFTQFKALVGQPCFVHKAGKIVIQIPYFMINGLVNEQGLTSEKMDALGLAITSLVRNFQLNKTVLTPTVREDQGDPFGIHLGNGQQQTLRVEAGNEIVIDSVNQLSTSLPVVELRFVQLRYPYLDSSILAQYIAMNAGKYNFLRIKKLLFNKINTGGFENLSLFPVTCEDVSTMDQNQVDAKGAKLIGKEQANAQLPSHLTGLKMELAGRLTTQRSIPRKTVSSVHKGSLQKSTGKNKTHYSSKTQFGTNFNQFASKNKIGAYTMKV